MARTSRRPATPTKGKLILLVSKHPSDADTKAKDALKEFDSSAKVVPVVLSSSIRTPRLDAIEYNMSIYRGLDSILGFIKMEKNRAADDENREREKALRKYLTIDPVLRVHKRKTADDRRALKLAQEEFGDKLTIIAYNYRELRLPVLYCATSVMEGLKNIKAFLSYIQKLPKPDEEPSLRRVG